jgi:protein-arginine kinase activator protein McsA
MERAEEVLGVIESDLIEAKPLNRKEQLEQMLAEAVEGDDFERAAELRDLIQQLGLKDG